MRQTRSIVLPLGWFFATLCIALLCCVAPTFAQDEADPGGEGEVLLEEALEEEPAPADAAPGGPAAEPGAVGPPSKSRLVWFYDSLGLSYSFAFLSLSFALVALFVMNVLGARRENVVPERLIEGFEAEIKEKRYQEAYELAKNDESFLGQVLAAGLGKLSSGYQQAIEAMQEVGQEENMKLEHRLSYMALIGTISPMVGLLGTVQGMIASFDVIARTAGSAPKATDLAQGISTALVTTLIGLAIAIPAIACHNVLTNRVARLVLEVGIVSENLMNRFSNVGPQKNPDQT